MLRSSGDRELTRFERLRFKLKRSLQKRLTEEAVITDKAYRSIFVCENAAQAYRALSLWIKEPGTMAWIDGEVRPGDRFLDIGANIGIYTLAAAHRVGPGGHVVAIEPHKGNVMALMRNVERNGFSDRIDILAFPVADRQAVEKFNYLSLVAASSGSQFGAAPVVSSEAFAPAGSELSLGTSVDLLIEAGAMQPPDLVKIDVDGIELKILLGMERLLRSPERPRAVQVELNVGEQEAIVAFLEQCGYQLQYRHFTKAGEQMRRAGKALPEIAHNAVFAPA